MKVCLTPRRKHYKRYRHFFPAATCSSFRYAGPIQAMQMTGHPINFRPAWLSTDDLFLIVSLFRGEVLMYEKSSGHISFSFLHTGIYVKNTYSYNCICCIF